MDKKRVIFIVEDDPGFNMLLTNYLTGKNKWEVHSFESGEECLKKLDLKPEIFLQDFDLPGMNGVEVMKKVKFFLPETEFIFLSAQTNINVAVEALKLGAFDYIMKDANTKESALHKIDQIFKVKNLLEEKQSGKKMNTILWGISILMAIIIVFLMLRG